LRTDRSVQIVIVCMKRVMNVLIADMILVQISINKDGINCTSFDAKKKDAYIHFKFFIKLVLIK